MTIIQKFKSDIYASDQDWHAGICFYTLLFYELEIFDDISCKLLRKIYLDKSSGGFNRAETISWQGDLKDMIGTNYILLRPDNEGSEPLKIWFEKVRGNSNWIYLDILKPDRNGDFKMFQGLILKSNN